MYPGTKIANRCIIHSGAVLGSDGFGLARYEAGWEKLNHIGGLIIEDDVEVGAGTCIDRGMLANTHIEAGVKLDNLIQIAHNIRIGKRSAIAGCSAIAGSTTIGQDCMIGGCAKINGHIEITDGTILLGAAHVSKSITSRGIFSSPSILLTRIQSHRLVSIWSQLPKIWQSMKKALGICTI